MLRVQDNVLSHRPADTSGAVLDRFDENGIGPEVVGAVLDDGGDALYGAPRSSDPEWAIRFGGPLAVTLLAAEVSALAAHLDSLASAVRAVADDLFLDNE